MRIRRLDRTENDEDEKLYVAFENCSSGSGVIAVRDEQVPRSAYDGGNVDARTYWSGAVPNVSRTVQDHLQTVYGLKAKPHAKSSHT